jgi:hypothetical protein
LKNKRRVKNYFKSNVACLTKAFSNMLLLDKSTVIWRDVPFKGKTLKAKGKILSRGVGLFAAYFPLTTSPS